MLEERTKVFGLDDLDARKKIYVLEGPIDSMFLPNAIAAAGSDLINIVNDIDKAVFVFDNEPRNKEIVKKIETCVNHNLNVCIWPNNIRQKDVNAMVLNGVENVQSIIDKNTYRGVKANLALHEWSRI